MIVAKRAPHDRESLYPLLTDVLELQSWVYLEMSLACRAGVIAAKSSLDRCLGVAELGISPLTDEQKVAEFAIHSSTEPAPSIIEYLGQLLRKDKSLTSCSKVISLNILQSKTVLAKDLNLTQRYDQKPLTNSPDLKGYTPTNPTFCMRAKGPHLTLFSKRDRVFSYKFKMAASQARGESKLSLEIRTKSVEQTLVPLVTQVCFQNLSSCASFCKF